MNGLLHGLDETTWAREPSAEDWAMIEIVCHMLDTEREIHHMQIKLFSEQNEPFHQFPVRIQVYGQARGIICMKMARLQ